SLHPTGDPELDAELRPYQERFPEAGRAACKFIDDTGTNLTREVILGYGLAAVGRAAEVGEGTGIFRGPAAKEFDWGEIFRKHAEWGETARHRTRDTSTVFVGMTARQIMACVQRAWKLRQKASAIQVDPLGASRALYHGYDPVSKMVVGFWF